MYSYQLKGYLSSVQTLGRKKDLTSLLAASCFIDLSNVPTQARNPIGFSLSPLVLSISDYTLDRSYPAIFQLSKPPYPLDAQKPNDKLAVMVQIPALHGI